MKWTKKEREKVQIKNISLQVDTMELDEFSQIRPIKSGLDEYKEMKSKMKKSKMEETIKNS